MKLRFAPLLLAAALFFGACSVQPPCTLSPELLPCSSETFLFDASALRPEGPWAVGGSRVYFGQYGGAPLIFRVLPESEYQTVEPSLLLDCETAPERMPFDDDFQKNDAQPCQPNDWPGSDIEALLNGEAYLSSVFSGPERAAIAATSLAEVSAPYSGGDWVDMYTDRAASDFLFLLSAAEAQHLYADNAARLKDEGNSVWWLRSAFDKAGNGMGTVHADGHVCNNSICNLGVMVSPALNVGLSGILFATAAGDAGEWKLTLRDPAVSVAVPARRSASRTDAEVAVPCAWSGAGVTHLSVLFTDLPCTEPGARALYCGTVPLPETAKTAVCTFTLPAALAGQVCGRDYHAYLAARCIGAADRSDSAGDLYEFSVPPSA